MKYEIYVHDRILGIYSLPCTFDSVEVYDNIVIGKIDNEIVSKISRTCFSYYLKVK